MAEETITNEALLKALEDMENLLNKGQIVTGPGSSKGAMKEEKEAVEEKAKNGTDYDGKVSKAADSDEGGEEEEDAADDEDEEKAVKVKKGVEAKKDDKPGLEELLKKEDVKKAKKDEEEEESVDEEDEKKSLATGGDDSLVNKKGKGERSGGDESLVSKGMDDESLDVTQWLYAFAHAVNKAFIGLEARVEDKISKSIGDQGDLSKAMSNILSSLDGQIQGRIDAVDAIEKSAARAPKSVMRAGDVLEKSKTAQTSKRDILAKLYKGMEEGKVAPLTILKYETTGQIQPDILKSVGIESAPESV